jgi:hypothetical protein
MPESTMLVEVIVIEEHYPRYDPAHGTPDPMVRRLATIRAAGAEARFEQTDYGHPGRFNPWDPRGVDTKLQPRTEQLRDVCTALSPLLS